MTDFPAEPAAWVGCLACYNEGTLNGEWVPANEAEDVDVEELHDGETSHDELWVFDHENVLIKGECDPAEIAKWGEAFEAVGAKNWLPYLAWVSDLYGESYGPADPIAFNSAYVGHYDSLRDYLIELGEEQGVLESAPDALARNFDWDWWVKENSQGFSELDAPSGVWVYFN